MFIDIHYCCRVEWEIKIKGDHSNLTFERVFKKQQLKNIPVDYRIT